MTFFTNSLFQVYTNLSFKKTGPEVYNNVSVTISYFSLDLMLHKSGIVSCRMDQVDRTRLLRNRVVLQTQLNLDDVLPHLVAKGVLVDSDAERIKSLKTCEYRVRLLFFLLESK